MKLPGGEGDVRLRRLQNEDHLNVFSIGIICLFCHFTQIQWNNLEQKLSYKLFANGYYRVYFMWCWWPTHQLHKVTSVSTITVYDNSIHRTHYVAKASLRVPVSAGKWVFYFLSSNKKNIYGFLATTKSNAPDSIMHEKKNVQKYGRDA